MSSGEHIMLANFFRDRLLMAPHDQFAHFKVRALLHQAGANVSVEKFEILRRMVAQGPSPTLEKLLKELCTPK
jgi:hypothetical protein